MTAISKASVVVLVGMLVGSCYAGALAESGGPQGRILIGRYFASAQQADLFIVRPGRAADRLTKTAAFESSAVFSPDGNRIAFVRRSPNKKRFSLMVMGRDGSQARVVASGAGTGVTWSPDSRWITFIRLVPDPGSELVIVSPDGGEERVLAIAPHIDHALDWAPDSSKVVFSQRLEEAGVGNLDLYEASIDEGASTQLTDSVGDDVWPSFSPEGSSIAFSSDREDPGLESGDPTSSEIYVMDSDGSEETRMTNSPATWDEAPAWSPKGGLIAFTRRYDDDVRFGAGADIDVVLLDVSDGLRQVLTRDRRRNDRSPIWSPDGRWIAFNRESADGSGDIHIIRFDGAALQRLEKSGRGDDYVLDWFWMDV